jgi:hypothetical protein
VRTEERAAAGRPGKYYMSLQLQFRKPSRRTGERAIFFFLSSGSRAAAVRFFSSGFSFLPVSFLPVRKSRRARTGFSFSPTRRFFFFSQVLLIFRFNFLSCAPAFFFSFSFLC